MTTLNKRVDMIGYITVRNSNPNGDLDMENKPRQDSEGYGYMTDVCLKRTMKDNVSLLYGGKPGYDMYIQKDRVALESKFEQARDEIDGIADLPVPAFEDATKARLCKKYYDVRTFGAVITSLTKIAGADGQIDGPVSVTFAESLEPIDPIQLSVDRVSIQTKKDAEKKTTEIGKKWIVPYAVYRFEVHVSPAKAKRTGFSEEDLNILIESIKSMFDNNRTSSKNDMELTKLFVFEHESNLGNCPIAKLNSLVHVEKITPDLGRDYYDITIDESSISNGVTLIQ